MSAEGDMTLVGILAERDFDCKVTLKELKKIIYEAL